MRRRGLEDVLHHFIPEDEQREARERVQGSVADPAVGRRVRWCIPLRSERPLALSLAVDLGAALAGRGRAAIVAPFPSGPLIQVPSRVLWRGFDPGDAEGLTCALTELPDDASALVLLAPEQLEQALAGLAPGLLDGLLLPVDATPWGLAQALGWLRTLPASASDLRLAAVVVAASNARAADDLGARLCAAARRQLRLELEWLGEVARDPASFRALLHGVPVVELDAGARSARSLQALARRLSTGTGTGV